MASNRKKTSMFASVATSRSNARDAPSDELQARATIIAWIIHPSVKEHHLSRMQLFNISR